ncbi:MAG: hypothetical protein IPP63_00820 [Chloracidobacterium sp.]|nr:hypothetical protein [Chloracidobacterium sp.]
MSRFSNIAIVAIFMTVFLTIDGRSQSCSSGQINGVFHTSCYPWTSGDGTFTIPNGATSGTTTVTKHNDQPRLQRALNAALGRLVFDEAYYYINDELTVYSYRTIVGTGRSSFVGNASYPILPSSSYHLSSKIVQVGTSKAIFKIGEGVQDVSIRDLALVSGFGTSGNYGILAQGGNGSNQSSLGFQFSNLKFTGFDKGIYVNAQNSAEWQFDNVRLDHSFFENCTQGVRINSHNSGWSVTSVDMLVPASGYGFYLENSTYMTLDLIIGNGPVSGTMAQALVYVNNHGNLSIRNTVAENFTYDVHLDGDSVYGTGRNYPVYLMNNTFMSGVTLKDSTVVSMGNQFGFDQADVSAIAKGTTQLYSIGDKFCFEGATCESNKGYTLKDDAILLFGTNKYKTEIDTLKLGSRTYSNLGSPGNGTAYYCSDCQQTSTCGGSGSGAFAKRINGAWSCN